MCKALWQSLYREHELFLVYLLSHSFASPEGAGRMLAVLMSCPRTPQHFSIMSCEGEGRRVKEHTNKQTYIYIYIYICLVSRIFQTFYSKTNQMHNISNLFYFGTTLHVLVGLYVHHQESRTVHTASGICHTGSVAAC